MKKTITLSVIFFIFVVSSNAQFTITPFFNPSPGDIERYRACDTVNVNPGNGGANVVWNFSNLSLHNDSIVISYIAASSTPFFSSFPTSTVAYTLNNQEYFYYKTTSSGYELMGLGSSPYTFIYLNLMTYMVYPFNYLSNHYDEFSGSGIQGTNVSTRSGNSVITCDGWGTLILPIGTINNVMRIKHTFLKRDSVYIGGVLTGNSIIYDTSYYWVKDNYKFALLHILKTTSTYYPGVTTIFSKSVNMIPSLTIGIKKVSTEIPRKFILEQNYPNPFNATTIIKFDIPVTLSFQRKLESSKVSLKIYDVLGREVATLIKEKLQAGTYKVEWDASAFASGIYFYQFRSDNFVETKKMLLVK